jgi:hypothetical protein
MLATTRPDLVKGIVMLAAGGKVPVPQRAREALWSCFDLALPDDVHIENVRYAFFAPANDPTVWRSGWYPDVAQMQRATTVGLDRNGPNAVQSGGGRAASVDAWWAGGSVPGGEIAEADTSLAQIMQESLLRDFNMQPRWIETTSRTTHENAIFSAPILKADGVNTVYLVTHAWHMPRAKAAFEATGITVIPAPTRFVTPPVWELKEFVLTFGSLQNSYFAFHEWIGLVWYSLAYR